MRPRTAIRKNTALCIPGICAFSLRRYILNLSRSFPFAVLVNGIVVLWTKGERAVVVGDSLVKVRFNSPGDVRFVRAIFEIRL